MVVRVITERACDLCGSTEDVHAYEIRRDGRAISWLDLDAECAAPLEAIAGKGSKRKRATSRVARPPVHSFRPID